MANTTSFYVLFFSKNDMRFIDTKDSEDGTKSIKKAMKFSSKEEAYKYNDERGYFCYAHSANEKGLIVN